MSSIEKKPKTAQEYAVNISRSVATRCVERMSNLKLRGAKRDSACLDYYCGAAAALEAAKNTAAPAIATQASLIVATRGYEGVRAILEDETT